MPRPPRRPDPDFEAPESEPPGKLVRHVVDQMGPHVIVAVAMVAFLYFYGMASVLYKFWTGRDFASLDFPLGVVSGATGAAAVSALLLAIKYRRKK